MSDTDIGGDTILYHGIISLNNLEKSTVKYNIQCKLKCQPYNNCIKVPITPKNVFHLVQSLYGIRKNAAQIFAFG